MALKVEQVAGRPAPAPGRPLARPNGWGDRLERLVHPVAVALRLPCLDERQRLRPESPCGKRRDALNRLGEKISGKISGGNLLL